MLALSLSVLSAIVRAVDTPGTSDAKVLAAERGSLVEAIAAKLEAEYVFPNVATEMSDAIRVRAARGEYDSVQSAQELAKHLTADLCSVSHDKHLRVIYQAEGAHDEPEQPSADEIKAWREAEAKVNFGFGAVERMDGNIGYIAFRHFAPPTSDKAQR